MFVSIFTLRCVVIAIFSLYGSAGKPTDSPRSRKSATIIKTVDSVAAKFVGRLQSLQNVEAI